MNKNFCKENTTPQRRGRFLVQEIEDIYELNLPFKKQRYFSIENKFFFDKFIWKKQEDHPYNECFVYDHYEDRWVDTEKIWMNISHEIKKESENMRIIFDYDLINKKENQSGTEIYKNKSNINNPNFFDYHQENFKEKF